jgi:hypothetical protein
MPLHVETYNYAIGAEDRRMVGKQSIRSLLRLGQGTGKGYVERIIAKNFAD